MKIVVSSEKDIPNGYHSIKDMWDDIQYIRFSRGARTNVSLHAVRTFADQRRIPSVIYKNRSYYNKELLFAALNTMNVRFKETKDWYMVATLEDLKNPDVMLVRDAARIIGCKSANITSRVQNRTIWCRLHPKTHKQLVKLSEVREAVCWRKLSTLYKYLGEENVPKDMINTHKYKKHWIDHCTYVLYYYCPEYVHL